MKYLFTGALLASTILMSTASFAAIRTIKLSVPGMTCASCPYIVKASISQINGIKSVEATMTDLSATVTFDDTLTNVDEIRQATENVGYPSSLFK